MKREDSSAPETVVSWSCGSAAVPSELGQEPGAAQRAAGPVGVGVSRRD